MVKETFKDQWNRNVSAIYHPYPSIQPSKAQKHYFVKNLEKDSNNWENGPWRFLLSLFTLGGDLQKKNIIELENTDEKLVMGFGVRGQ